MLNGGVANIPGDISWTVVGESLDHVCRDTICFFICPYLICICFIPVDTFKTKYISRTTIQIWIPAKKGSYNICVRAAAPGIRLRGPAGLDTAFLWSDQNPKKRHVIICPSLSTPYNSNIYMLFIGFN